MKRIFGKIQLDHSATPRAIYRFVEKTLRSWLESRLPGIDREEISYRVDFQSEEGEVVSCQAEIRAGSRVWISSGYGKSLQQAFLKCLNHMMQTSVPIPGLYLVPGKVNAIS